MLTPSFNNNPFSNHHPVHFLPQPKTTIDNCEVSVILYNNYRNFVLGLMPLTGRDVYYRVFNNSDNKNVIGYGIHEKFIHDGQSVVDISVGPLDYPWLAADANKNNEFTIDSLVAIVNQETDPLVAGRMRQLLQFVQHLPIYTRLYYYRGQDGLKSLTIVDQPNEVKMNVIVSWKP